MTKKIVRRNPAKNSVKKEKNSHKLVSEKFEELSKLVNEKDELLEKIKLFASKMPKDKNVFFRNMNNDEKSNLDWAANAE